MASVQILSLPPRVKDLSGERFGRLTVQGFIGFHVEPTGRRRPKFICRCDCGNTHTAVSASLRGGMVRSCGCLSRDPETVERRAALTRGVSRPREGRHGMSHMPEHNAWTGIKQRCYNPRVRNFASYGGRGIVMCEAWRDSFERFYADLGPRPSRKHSLDRIDNDGPYEPGNVRWATAIEQANHKRDTHYVSYQGQQVSLADAERLSGVSQKVLAYRSKAGWPTERLYDPINEAKRPGKR